MTTENKTTIVLTPMGMIIGRMAEGEITKPRRVLFSETEQGVQIQLKEILGNPDVFIIGSCCYYFSESPDLNELYFSAVTGIGIVKPEVIS